MWPLQTGNDRQAFRLVSPGRTERKDPWEHCGRRAGLLPELCWSRGLSGLSDRSQKALVGSVWLIFSSDKV